MGSIRGTFSTFDVRRIAVIGAGPSGLAAARYLISESIFDAVDIYEQQAEVGGVWYHTSEATEDISVPQTTPRTQPDQPIWPKDSTIPIFSNPMYDHLHANIPKDLMCFSDKEFPSNSRLLPDRQDIEDYLVQYAEDIRHMIRFCEQVQEVELSEDNGRERWTVTSKSVIDGRCTNQMYDAVVIANGHYSSPYVPSVPGIEAFKVAHPSIISHAKVYRNPEAFKGKKVIVVGGGPSAFDIGNQISRVCKSPLLNSVLSPMAHVAGSDKEEVPEIVEFLSDGAGVRFKNGRIEKDIDAVVYCTGYLYSYPFLKTVEPPLVTTGKRVLGVYKQIFSIAHPTLAFTALPMKIIPFPLSEAQSAVIARVWANRLDLPTKEDMIADENREIEERGDGKAFHILGFPRDAEYINSLHDWSQSARPGAPSSKKSSYWDGRHKWERSLCPSILLKFIETGGSARTLEELGWSYKE
ncbi:flavin dependent monooxygenase-like protein [Xylogone sp. PMI_703]|nr:flavin dependent monooxygenase-like protein [Xylogone sp. PMI_703]